MHVAAKRGGILGLLMLGAMFLVVCPSLLLAGMLSGGGTLGPLSLSLVDALTTASVGSGTTLSSGADAPPRHTPPMPTPTPHPTIVPIHHVKVNPPPLAPVPHFSSVMFLGDSLTGAYYATDQGHGYMAQVASALATQIIATQGIYGYSAQMTDANMRKTPPPAVGLAIVELGTNDREDPGLFAQDYSDLLSRLRTANPSMRLVCLGPWQDASHVAYNDAVRSACQRFGGRFVDLMPLFNVGAYHGPAGRKTWLGPADWFHPNDAGHAAIAWQVLLALRS